MLLVDNHETQFGELDAFFQQGVRANDQVGVALRDVAADIALAILFDGAGQQHDAVSSAFENPPRGKIMLLRQDLRRRHQRDLAAVFDGDDGRFERHDRLARPNVPLQQPAHGIRLLHVGSNFFQDALLRGRGMKRQDLLDGLARPVVEPEGDAGLRLHLPAAKFEAQFHEEEFFKNQPKMRGRAR